MLWYPFLPLYQTSSTPIVRSYGRASRHGMIRIVFPTILLNLMVSYKHADHEKDCSSVPQVTKSQ